MRELIGENRWMPCCPGCKSFKRFLVLGGAMTGFFDTKVSGDRWLDKKRCEDCRLPLVVRSVKVEAVCEGDW